MNQIIESSVVVRVFRWLTRDSVVAAGVKSLLGVFSSVDQAFARASADKESQVDQERLRSVLKTSVIVRAVDAVFSAPFAAWEHARVRPIVDDVRAGVTEMSMPQRIRLGGWMLAVGVITRATLYVLSGATVTGATLAVWGIVVMVSVVMMIASRQVAVGWNEWKRRKG